jgi:uroporphyrinogen decarboxylase
MASKTALTSHERVRRMFAHEDHDRIPRHDSFWQETLERWMGEGLEAKDLEGARRLALDRLASDLRQLCWFWPHPFPERNEVVEEDEQTRVMIGPSGTIERYWKHKSGTPEHIGWECSSRAMWDEVYRPAMVNQPVTLDLDEIRTADAAARGAGKWTYLAGVEAFEAIRKIVGDEQFMYLVFDDPEWIVDIANVEADLLLRVDVGVQPDCVWLFGDMAFKNMTFCSPGQYRELIWPQHKRIADWARDHGMRIIYHTDGDVREVMELYLEAGFDALHPLESKAGMDVRELAPGYGERISYVGNIDVMTLLTNDLDRIEHEVVTKFAAAMATRGYMYHSDHSVPPQVAWPTYLALIEMIERHGVYP